MDLEAEKQFLLRRDAEWSKAASEGRDVEHILSFWTDDAVVLPPGLPPVSGKPALRDYVEASLRIPGFNINWVSTEVNISPDGNLAYIFSDNTITMNGPEDTPVTTTGRAVTIWRKEQDGEWRCAVDVWNAGPPV